MKEKFIRIESHCFLNTVLCIFNFETGINIGLGRSGGIVSDTYSASNCQISGGCVLCLVGTERDHCIVIGLDGDRIGG